VDVGLCVLSTGLWPVTSRTSAPPCPLLPHDVQNHPSSSFFSQVAKNSEQCELMRRTFSMKMLRRITKQGERKYLRMLECLSNARFWLIMVMDRALPLPLAGAGPDSSADLSRNKELKSPTVIVLRDPYKLSRLIKSVVQDGGQWRVLNQVGVLLVV